MNYGRSVLWILGVVTLGGCAMGDLQGAGTAGPTDGAVPSADAGSHPRDGAASSDGGPSDASDALDDGATTIVPTDAGLAPAISLLPGSACRDLAVAHVAPDPLFGFEVTGRPSSAVEIWASRPHCGVAPFLYETVALDAAGHGTLARYNTGSASCTDPLLGAWTVWAAQGGVRSAPVELAFESTACGLACDRAGTFCPPAAPAACAPLVFGFDGAFTPTAAEPTRRVDFDVPDGLTFARIDVELDFVRGPWAADHPVGQFGMHNLFWLHRGLRGQDWLDNSVGYMNFTAASTLRVESNLGVTDPAIWSDVLAANGAATTEGERYHVAYSYDAGSRRWWLRLGDAHGASLAYREGAARLESIVGRSPYRNGASAFFLEIGHVPWVPENDGPEVATLGWTYSAVQVRFYPLGPACP